MKKKPGAAKKKTSAERRSFFIPWMIAVGVVALIGFVLLVRKPLPDYDERPAPRTVEDLIPFAAEPQLTVSELQAAVELLLWDVGVDLRSPQVEARDGVAYLLLDAPLPGEDDLAKLVGSIENLSGQIRVVGDDATAQLKIFQLDVLKLQVRFAPRQQGDVGPSTPQVALIVDDLGRDLQTVARLLDLEVDLTFSILPGETHATRAAQMVHAAGREILIHLPMEPQAYPEVDPGADALLVRMSAIEIRERMGSYLSRVPYAVGGNNHMGSRFTEDREGMRTVIESLAAADLFFVDSLTSNRSLALETARQLRVPTAARDVFLDNVPEVDAITAELHRLVRVARKRGRAIGICHPYPETLTALEREVAALQEDGIEFVPVSRLLLR